MKRNGLFLALTVAGAALALNGVCGQSDADGQKTTGKYKMRAALTDEKVDGALKNSFKPDVAKIYLLVESKTLKAGDKVRTVWIADDVGDAAPKNTRIDEATQPSGDTGAFTFSLSKPDKGWPIGTYHVDAESDD